jgi:hypothetical protein
MNRTRRRAGYLRRSAENIWCVMKPDLRSNKKLQHAFLEIIETQLRDEDPPETKRTFCRLIESGHSPQEAKRLLSVVVGLEVACVMKNQEPFNHARFVAALDLLPDLPE